MRRMLETRIGEGALDQQDGLASTLLRPTVLGKLRNKGLSRRSQVRCLRLDELIERFGFKPTTAEHIVRATQRK